VALPRQAQGPPARQERTRTLPGAGNAGHRAAPLPACRPGAGGAARAARLRSWCP
jgi:hypothetical protein